MILVIDNYDSFVHNLARYLRRLGCETIVFDPLVDKTGYSGKWLEQIPLVSSTKELGSALHVPAPMAGLEVEPAVTPTDLEILLGLQ